MSKVRKRRSRNRQTKPASPLADKPFRPLVNPYTPIEVISPEQIEQIHNASMHILENIGLEFLEDEAFAYWQQAGAKTDPDTRRVWLDRGLVLDLVANAPTQFTLRARNPKHAVTIGGNHINFCTVGAVPYYSDLDYGRRPGTLADFQRMVKLAQVCGPHSHCGRLVCGTARHSR